MIKTLKCTLVVVVCLAMMATATAQNKAAQNRMGKVSATHRHSQVQHKSSRVFLPDESKKLNSDLAKLESQSSRSIRPARRTTEKKAVLPGKSVMQQDRAKNPAINFTYKGDKSGSATGSGAMSHSGGRPQKATPRLK